MASLVKSGSYINLLWRLITATEKKKLIQNFELALPVSSVKVYNFLVTTKLKQKAEGISCPTVPHKHIDTLFAVIIAFKAEEPGTNVFTFAIHW